MRREFWFGKDCLFENIKKTYNAQEQVGLTLSLTFDPEAASAAVEVTAGEDSVTMLGDL